MKWNRILPRSIRRRLPLSYAAVALFTALVLGAVLLSALRLYYRDREADYLARSASYIQAALAESMAAGVTDENLQDQVTELARLTETRVELVDGQGMAMADSGTFDFTQQRQLALQERLEGFRTRSGVPPVPEASRLLGTNVETGRLPLVIPRIESLYIFLPGRADREYQSDLSTTVTVRHQESGETLGYLVVSGGPGYSQGILSGVALAWAVAGAVAVLLAALVGWLASRRMSRPLLGLTGVTAKMADGDLSVRADVRRQDEFGALAVSFNDMAERLQAFILTLQRFVADAAHELNTPLTALRNSLDLALEEEDRAVQTALIKDGRSQVGRLEELAQGLLDLSRLESGELGPEHRPVDLVSLALKISESYASQAEQAGLAFTLNGPLEVGEYLVQGDAAQLRRALGGVLDNAIKFTPEGGTVGLGISAGERWVTLQVEDSGIGIPEKDLPLLFNRFHRGGNTAGYPGSGLGLAIVRAIVLRHGGEVWAENTGRGARITLRLPR
jgi:signal transduction histidine kinase